jgi:hypothetical protein
MIFDFRSWIEVVKGKITFLLGAFSQMTASNYRSFEVYYRRIILELFLNNNLVEDNGEGHTKSLIILRT